MKKILLVLSMLLTIVFVYSQAPDTWIQKKDFGGTIRYGAVGFSIGGKGYIGTGYNQTSNSYTKDFWEYDPSTDTWMQKADFGGAARYLAVGFSIGNKGYLGTGAGIGFTNDFWEYDPIANIWTRKADFGGNSRWTAAGFSIGNKGYLGTGYSGRIIFKDFWEYDPASNIWLQKADFGGLARSDAVGFSIKEKGYIGTGYRGVYLNDFWEYDPVSNKWQKKADFGGGVRSAAVGFSISNKGYVGTGSDGAIAKKDFWEYDPTTNTWIQKADLVGTALSYAVGFSIGDKGYIGTGSDEVNDPTKDFWEYTPGEDTGCQAPSNLKVPSISDTSAILKWTLPADSVNGFDILYQIIGSTPVRKRHATGTTTHIAIGNLLPGTIYRWQIRSDCTADTTNWLSGPDFTTTSSAGSSLNATAVKANNVSVQIMPNPNNGNFTIQMQLPAKAALTTLTVYNSFGIKVWQQDAGMLSGSVNRNIELKSKLRAGVYTLMIQHGDTRLMQKFVIEN